MTKLDTTVRGSYGLKMAGGQVDEEWLSSLRGTRLLWTYREMLDQCPIIGRAVRTLRLLLGQPVVRVVPASDDKQAVDAAALLESCMREVAGGFRNVDYDANEFPFYGHALFEVQYRYRDGKNGWPSNDGRIGWASIQFRAPETLSEWRFDKQTGEIDGVWQSAPDLQSRRYLPISKCILFRLDARKNSPTGRSMLRNAVVDYRHKRSIQQLEGIGIERDLSGIPWMQLPADILSGTTSDAATALESYKSMLGAFRNNEQAYLLTPAESDREGKPTGFKFGLISTPGAKQYDTDKVIRRCEQRIAMVLFDELALLGSERVGSYSLHDSKTNVVAMAVGALLQLKAETWNQQAVWPLMRLNVIPQQYWPTLEYGDVEQVDANLLADSVAKLVDAGVLTPSTDLSNRMCEALDLPVQATPDVETPSPARVAVVAQAIAALQTTAQQARAAGQTATAEQIESVIQRMLLDVGCDE